MAHRLQLILVVWYLSTRRYQINAQTELAIRYNDISPLENHHAAVAFEILSQVIDYTVFVFRIVHSEMEKIFTFMLVR